MGSRGHCSSSILVVALALPFAVSLGACHKSSEEEASEASKATAEKEHKEREAFRELEHGDDKGAAKLLVESQEAGERAARESRDVFAAVARERDRYRVILAKEIGWIDRRVSDMERVSLSAEGPERLEKEREIVAARDWRALLRQDLETLEHPPPDTDWTALKARIERDLDENRPPSVPRSYEKSYGI